MKNKLIILLLACLAFGLWSCEDDYYQRTSQNGASELISIIDKLKQNDRYSKFVELLNKSGVDQLLVKGTVYTVFAPTNEAIEAYDQSSTLPTASMDSSQIRAFVEFHIAFGIYYKYDFEKNFLVENNNRYTTRLYNAQFNQFKNLSVFPEAFFGKLSNINYSQEYTEIYGRTYNPKDSSFFVESAKVIPELMDVSCSNGVIHGIDRALQPLKNTLETLATNPDYSLYYGFINRFDSLVPVYKQGVISHYRTEYWYTNEEKQRVKLNGLLYSEEDEDITLFAPTNKVLNEFFEPYLENLGGSVENIPDDIVIELLKYNQANSIIHKSRLYKKDMLSGMRMTDLRNVFTPLKYVDKPAMVSSNGFIYPAKELLAPPRLTSVTGKILLDPRFKTYRYVLEEAGYLSYIAEASYASSDFLFGERVNYPLSWTLIAPSEKVFTDSLTTPIFELTQAELRDLATYWILRDGIYLQPGVTGEFERGTFTYPFEDGYYKTFFRNFMRKQGNTVYSSLFTDSTANIVATVSGSNGVIYIVDDMMYNMRRGFNVFSQISRFSSMINMVYTELTNGLHSHLLNKELLKSTGDYTLFLPSDEAMEDYDAIAENDPDLKTWEEMNTEERDYFLRNHIIRKRVMLFDQEDQDFYSSVGNPITLYKHLGQFKLKANEKIPPATFVLENQQASNGVLNIINNVIIP